ncbi:NAD-dependent epimerase/dehydratase family protein [Marinilongibacter aquaticus]|uniref:polysaccharide biosynthesis C-terminal domain-containing protein n=1 Tax=Marinilongibacter aquaticus TaxID=2975157 RepID=UPI0021BDE820|nr:NAD-dependent epimerase/dehydratase family protein [Marinilongibacter aquaticus]UBM57644.1 NAD-dependent epimerase/dehydratase family protein [Marinilongibacter aquaticus]
MTSLKRIGITGVSGFIGGHLKRNLEIRKELYEVIPFDKHFFSNHSLLEIWVSKCDVIVHFAALNRHNSESTIYSENVALVEQLINALERSGATPHLIFASSIQESKDNMYGKSKAEGRRKFEEWAHRNGARLNGLIIPNVFGPFGKPNYNSFISTFCFKLINEDAGRIVAQDGRVKLIYVQDLIKIILKLIDEPRESKKIKIPYSIEVGVYEVLERLEYFHRVYILKGEIPCLKSKFDYDLFNTFRSFISLERSYPFFLRKNEDNRGVFVELVRLGVGGQVSFSTTKEGVIRGNHFHTRKIERFAVIQGKAQIKLRKIDEQKLYSFDLDGDNPAFVDMPIWYTHSLKNIGEGDLYTIFWINEAFDPNDPDTFLEQV